MTEEYKIKVTHRKNGKSEFEPFFKVKDGRWQSLYSYPFTSYEKAANFIDIWRGNEVVKTEEIPYP